MRSRGRVDNNQAEIVDALRGAGCSVWSLANLGHGAPDLLVFSPAINQHLIVEVKTREGKLTSFERDWHARWKGPVHIVRSVSEALEIVGVEVLA